MTDEPPSRLDDLPALPLFGEDWLTALLLAMVLDHCGSFSPEKRRTMTSFFSPDPSPGRWLDSYNNPDNAAAMIELEGLIEITSRDGDRIIAKLAPEGEALIKRLRAEQKGEAGADEPPA